MTQPDYYGQEMSWTIGETCSWQGSAMPSTEVGGVTIPPMETTECCLPAGEAMLTCLDEYGDGVTHHFF